VQNPIFGTVSRNDAFNLIESAKGAEKLRQVEVEISEVQGSFNFFATWFG
jgi:hypothetical protein